MDDLHGFVHYTCGELTKASRTRKLVQERARSGLRHINKPASAPSVPVSE